MEVRTPKVARQLPGVALIEAGLADGELYLVSNIESVAEGSRVRLMVEGAETPVGDDDGAQR